MRTVELDTYAPGSSRESVFSAVADTSGYAAHTDTVLNVAVDQVAPGRTRSAWAVRFRDGVLKYVSEEVADGDSGEIRFHAIDGDLELFEGVWRISGDGDGTTINLQATFDSGLGTLSDIVDPIAEQTLRDNFRAVLSGLIGDHLVFSE